MTGSAVALFGLLGWVGCSLLAWTMNAAGGVAVRRRCRELVGHRTTSRNGFHHHVAIRRWMGPAFSERLGILANSGQLPDRRAGVLLALLVTVSVTMPAVAAVGLVAVVARRAVQTRQRRRQALSLRVAATSTFVEMLRVAGAGGISVRGTVLAAAAFQPDGLDLELGRVVSLINRGLPFEGVMSEWARLGGPVSNLATLLTSADATGAPIGPTLARLGADLRRQRRRDLETRARRLPVTMLVPLVVCVLPSFIVLAVVPMVAVGLHDLGGP